MASVDQRIVSMKFDNAQFENGVRTSLGTLEKLKDSLKFNDSSNSINNLKDSLGKLNVSSLSTSVEELGYKFDAMAIVAKRALENLTDYMMNKLGGAIQNTIGLISSGGMRRALNLENARFSLRGLLESTKEIDGVEQTVLNYGFTVDQVMGEGGPVQNSVLGTAYGLDEAAKASSNFIASGITDLDDLEYHLKSISGTAAQTNSTYEETARIYQKVAGQGRVMGDDLNSIATRGVNASATLATYINGLEGGYRQLGDEAIEFAEKEGFSTKLTETNVRKMVSAGLISFDTFSRAMFETFGENAFKANETYSGSLSNLKAALSRFGEKFYTPYLNNMRDLFNSLRPLVNTLSKLLDPIIQKINEILKSLTSFSIDKLDKLNEFFTNLLPKDTIDHWEKFGEVVEGSKKKIDNLGSVVNKSPIEKLTLAVSKSAEGLKNFASGIGNIFKDIFKGLELPNFIDVIYDVGFAIADLGSKFKSFTSDTSASTFFTNIGKIITNVIGIFKSLWSIAKQVFSFISPALSELGDVLVLASTGVELVTRKLDEFLSSNNKLGFLDELKNKLSGVSDFFDKIKDAISGFLKSLDSTDASPVIEKITGALKSLWDVISDIASKIGSGLSSIFSALTDNLDPKRITGIASLGALVANGGALYMFYSFFKNFGKGFSGIKGTIDSVKDALSGLTGLFSSDSFDVDTDGIKSFAVAIGILSGALLLLSMIDADKLTHSTVALATVMTEIVTAIAVLGKITDDKKQVNNIRNMTLAISILSGAIFSFAMAFKMLGEMDWDQVQKGTVAMAGLIGSLIVYMGAMSAISSKNSKLMKSAGTLIGLAVAIDLLVIAVKKLGELDYETLSQGLISVAVLLGTLSLYNAFSSVGGTSVSSGLGILALAGGIVILSTAVEKLGSMNPETVASGLLAIAGALGIIAAFSVLVNNSNPLSSAAGLIITAAGILMISNAMQMLAGIDTLSLAASLVSMAVAMGIIVAAIRLIPNEGAVGSAVSITVAAAGIVLLSSALSTLSTIPLTGILTGLTAIAGGLLMLGIAVKALAGSELTLMALGVAMALFGAGVLALATAIGVLTPILLSFSSALVGSVEIILSGIITMSDQIIEAISILLTAVLTAIVENGPLIFEAINMVIEQLLNAIAQQIPNFLETVGILLESLLNFIVTYIPMIVDAGMQLILGLLQGIRDHIGEIVLTALEIVTNFINGIAAGLPGIIDAGFNLLLSFIHGITNAINTHSYEIGEAAWDLAEALVMGVVNGIAGFFSKPVEKIKELGESMLGDFGDEVSFENLKEVAKNMIDGIIEGIGSFAGGAIDSIIGFGSDLLDGLKGILGINSPSTETDEVGKNLVEGLKNGVTDYSSVTSLISKMASDVLGLLNDGLSDSKTSKTGKTAINGLIDGINSVNPKLKSTTNDLTDDVRNRFDSEINHSNFSEYGHDAMDGIVSGVSGDAPNVVSEFENVSTNSRDITSENLNSNVFSEYGYDAMAGLENGIYSKSGSVESASRSVASNARSAVSEEMTYSSFSGIGSNAMSGLSAGISSRLYDVLNTVSYAGTAITNQMRATMQIASPSKKFIEIGRYCMAGLEQAFSDTRHTEHVIEQLGKTITESVSSSVETDGLVLTPVLDLSNIQNGISSIDKMMGNDPSLLASISGNVNSMNNSNPIQSGIDKLTSLLNNLGNEQISTEEIYNAVRRGASEATFVIRLGGKTIASVVNEVNNDILVSNNNYLGVW